MAFDTQEIDFTLQVPDVVVKTGPELVEAPAIGQGFGGATAVNFKDPELQAALQPAPEPEVAKRPSLQTAPATLEERADISGGALQHNSSGGVFAECFGKLCEATSKTMAGGIDAGINVAHAQQMQPETPKVEAKPEGQQPTALETAQANNTVWTNKTFDLNHALKPPMA